MQVNKKAISKQIDDAEHVFRKCFEYVTNFVNIKLNEETEISLLTFQSILAECLYGLMQEFQHLCKYENYLIQNKNSYKAKWFNQRMKQVHLYKQAIEDTINIGKEIGDGFTWVLSVIMKMS